MADKESPRRIDARSSFWMIPESSAFKLRPLEPVKGLTSEGRNQKAQPPPLLLNEAPFQRDGHGVSAVIGLKLRQNALYVRLNGGFGNCQLFRNDLVGSAARNVP
jgi:hypothetical protein